ncbi:TolC family protein [Chlorobium phaeovibrioides]|uniref:Outer membrane efflux protein n=1 Tax=Chlorobium phaeovibrioides (strain DSM 265 / 1930) TaxID=290318 RepID=A4SF55_CHLPM|nr:TolC family protein [Chlorobium phaeovibrioides]RTY37290.1 TolC family protein [Chlorobium phaeovibrioides]HCD37073.1 TolC family protein [Chlorobium sp.]
MVKNIVVSFLLVAASFTPVHAADKAPKDSSVAGELRVRLEDAVRIGLQKSRTLELARLDRRMSSEKLMEATSPVLPQITSGFTYTRSLQPSVMFLPNFPGVTSPMEISSDNSATATLEVSQSLFNGSAYASIRAAATAGKMSDEAYRNAESAVLSDISMAYYDALISRDQLKLVEESIARWEESRKDTQAMFRQGVVADIDTLKAFLSVENLRPDLIQAETRVNATMTRLKNTMGVSLETPLVLLDTLSVGSRSYPGDLAAAWSEAMEKRPDIRQLELQVKAEKDKITAVRAERFPMLAAVGQLESQTAFDDEVQLSDSRWPVSSWVGVQVSLPIFTGYRISSRVQQAKIAQFQTMTRLEDLRANAMAEIELRLSAWREAEKRIDVQSSTIAMAQRGYRISLLRFREGVGSRLELTDSELQLNKARTNYLQAVYDYLAAGVLLDRSLGRIPR